ncbi:iroquois-class homeodomain protein IRX-5 [Ochlerotatus camptorhynchus]|uniref:iroquois-class homeodomain protein IRX-5 n=1 Tax=Ochlerotatus camptorhynchus TaxID=644619 RepID=UPI0031DAE7BD
MEKSSRPVRNRKRSRKVWPPGDIHRPIKRLFTPEIKRMLKDWLVRRRENPYPNREEKKLLAYETGLTYTQICNWFANWRRKLKNSGNDPIKKTWCNLIKNYNTNAKGNVEQFSICSEDSIWGENGEDSQGSRSPPDSFSKRQYPSYTSSNNNNNNSKGFVNYMKYMERRNSETSDDDRPGNYSGNMFRDHSYTPKNYNAVFGLPGQPQCFQVTSTTEECPADFNCNTSSIIATNFPNAYRGENGTFYLTPSTTVSPSINHKSTNKYKSSIMEKYLRDLNEIDPESEPANNGCSTSPNPFQQMAAQSQSNTAPVAQMSCETRGPPSLSKWLESTAKFTPSKNNYIDWDQPGRPSSSKKRCHSNSFHQHQPTDEEGHHRATSQPPQEIDDTGEFGIHQKDEIDAAEALTRLANNFRMKFYT